MRDARFLCEGSEIGSHRSDMACLDDLDSILEVEHESQPSPWARSVFEKEFALDYSYVWVARSGDDISAFLVFWVVLDEVHILNVVTAPSARRNGLARFLVSQLIDVARGAQMTSVTLEVRDSNVAARDLYGGFGFKQIGRRPRYYSDNHEDALVLALILEEEPALEER